MLLLRQRFSEQQDAHNNENATSRQNTTATRPDRTAAAFLGKRRLKLVLVACLVVVVVHLFSYLRTFWGGSFPCTQGCSERIRYDFRIENSRQWGERATHLVQPKEQRTEPKNVQDVYNVCEFDVKNKFATHLPHTLQQLYKCFSYWQSQAKGQPVLLISSRFVHRQLLQIEFLRGFLEALDTLFQVQIVEQLDHDDDNNDKSFHIVVPYIPFFLAQTPAHLHELRDRVVQQYFYPNTTTTLTTLPHACSNASTTIPRITILDRRGSRKFRDAQDMAQAIQHQLSLSFASLDQTILPEVRVAYSEGKTFAQQVETFAFTDILLSPHGAQLVGIPFLPSPCSHVLEFFPQSYLWPEYMASLAASSNVSYSYMYLGPTTDTLVEQKIDRGSSWRSKLNRYKARRVTLCPPHSKVVEAVMTLVQEWQTCCQQQQKAISV